MHYWVKRFLEYNGTEDDLLAAKEICKQKKITLPISDSVVSNRLNQIYTKEMNDNISLFLGETGSEEHLRIAKKYANLLEIDLPLTETVVSHTLKNIYIKNVNKWSSKFMGSNSSLTYLKIAKKYAKLSNSFLPISKSSIEQKKQEIREMEYKMNKEIFLTYKSTDKQMIDFLQSHSPEKWNFKNLLLDLFLIKNQYPKKNKKYLKKLWKLLVLSKPIPDEIIEMILDY